MRRFIVLFLLFLLPLQVLSASVDDLNAERNLPTPANAVCACSVAGDADIHTVQALMPSEPGNQPSVHADLNDSVDTADVHCSARVLSVFTRSRYVDTIISDVFLAIIKPPVI